jgi:PHS family inorganic phosphate transporter-like MFS transporter
MSSQTSSQAERFDHAEQSRGMMLKLLLIRGLGFFNDAYYLFIMNVVNVVLTEQYGPEIYTAALQSNVNAATLVGALLGQIVFGLIGDRFGRRLCMIMTCIILIIGGIFSALAYGKTPTGTLWVLVIARGILGFGIGGEYPLSASSSAEDATSVKNRNTRVAMTFSAQGFGALMAALMGYLFVYKLAPKEHGKNDDAKLELIWRSLFGIGVLPSLVVVYFRIKAKETSLFLLQQQQRQCQTLVNSSKLNQKSLCSTMDLFYMRCIMRHYGKFLFGTASTWFLFDIVFYAQNLFAASILTVVASDNNRASYSSPSLELITRLNVYLALLALPGYFCAVLWINQIGRQRMQLMGFSMIAILLLGLGIGWKHLQEQKNSSVIFIVIYGLTLFFANFGPNTTTFVMPTELFPTRIRSTCHGFSAAMGKAGAAVGSYGFSPLVQVDNFGFTGVFYTFSGLCILSLPLTWYCLQDNDTKTFEEMDQEFEDIIRECQLEKEEFIIVEDLDLDVVKKNTEEVEEEEEKEEEQRGRRRHRREKKKKKQEVKQEVEVALVI